MKTKLENIGKETDNHKKLFSRFLKIVVVFNSGSDIAEERISELENRSEEIFQNSEQRQQKMKNMEERLRIQDKKVRILDMYLIRVLKNRE